MTPALRLASLCLVLLATSWGAPALAEEPAAKPDAPATTTPLPGGDTVRRLLNGELPPAQALLPRSVRAATAAVGLGRPRLALVVGNRSAGREVVQPAAARDAQAVSAALRAGGFVVMAREDLSVAELRTQLAEFRQRLQPNSVGLVYFAGLGLQVDGRSVVLGRDAPLNQAAAVPTVAELAANSVPLTAFAEALQGPPEGLRLLVVDAAYTHAKLPATGLGTLAMPAGTMALFSQAPGQTGLQPALAPEPSTNVKDPSAWAASPFGREMARVFSTAGLSAPDALRQARLALMGQTQGKQVAWVGGDTAADDELAEPGLLDAFLPRTPGEAMTDIARQMLANRGGGERAVSEFANPATSGSVETPESSGQRSANQPARQLPNLPSQAVSTLANAATGLATTAAAAEVAKVVATGQGAVAAAKLASEAAASVASLPLAALTSPSSGSAQPAAQVASALSTAATVSDLAGSANGNGGGRGNAATGPATSPPPTPASPPARPVAHPAPAADGRTMSNPTGRGERPNFKPQVNAFGHAQGDSLSYRVLDHWRDQVSDNFTQRIDHVADDGSLIANDGQSLLDAQGRLQKIQRLGGQSTFTPAQAFWWAQPKPGDVRDVKFLEQFTRSDARGEIQWKGSMKVGQPERISLPAGEFDVLPIRGSGWYTEVRQSGGRGSGQWERTVYYSPQLKQPVAMEIRDTDWAGKLSVQQRVELTHAQTATTGQ